MARADETGGRARGGSEPTGRTRPLTLAELIDLELQLLRDRDRAIEDLDARDAPIAQRLAREELEGTAALRAWLDEVRSRDTSAGERVVELRDMVALVLFCGGLFAGITAVGAWLLHGTGTPINVIHFWPAVIGVQLALLAVWCLMAAPSAWLGWIPGVRAAQGLLAALARAIPVLVGRALLRVSAPGQPSPGPALAELRRLEWLYARLRMWLVTSLTQALAIGFNLGALAAFVAIPYVDDPAFGWRSRLLDPPAVTRLAEVVALPWRAWLPRALPSADEVAATRYSSLDPSPTRDRPGPAGVWAVWWPFLVASLVIYGLLPRLLLWAVSHLGVRMELRRAPRAHADHARLLERLALPPLDTRATAPESWADTPAVSPRSAASSLPSGPVRLLCWSGIPLDEGRAHADLGRAHIEVIGAVERVGALEQERDERVLEDIAQAKNGATPCLIVPLWEPPVGEYLDFVRDLRNALGDGIALWVLLFPLDTSPEATAGEVERWRGHLRGLGDPWLHVAPWPTGAA